MTILVFPSSLEASRNFAEDAKDWDQRVVGASSLENDPYAGMYDHWERLPYIHEPEFIPTLKTIVERYSINSIYTPHAPSYLRMSEIMQEFPSLRLRGDSPYASQMGRVAEGLSTAKTHLKTMESLVGKPVALAPDFVAALIADASLLYGECSLPKMVALCAAFTDAPHGDVVEIGTFFGKSAYIMNRLADRFSLGATIAVDPWNMGMSVQHDSPETIQKLSGMWDWELVFQGFLLNLLTKHAKPFNYLRQSSADAWKSYNGAEEIISKEFGRTPLAGSIAVLHIDGNHDEEAVAEDYVLWSSRLCDGGWIIFDDYEWSQGNGPRVVADRVRAQCGSRVMTYFVAGGAAFMKIRAV